MRPQIIKILFLRGIIQRVSQPLPTGVINVRAQIGGV
jgi:hypothetical protein